MLKLNVGLSKKIGESNYGSRGAIVGLEVELESTLIDEPERLKDRVRQLFSLAKQSIDEELLGQVCERTEGASSQGGQRNGRAIPRRATARQIQRLRTLAERQDLDLEKLVQKRLKCEVPEAISIVEASALITELQHRSALGPTINGEERIDAEPPCSE